MKSGLMICAAALAWFSASAELSAREAICSDPSVLFCEDFEDGTWSDTWDPTGYCCESDGVAGKTLAERNSVRCGGLGFEDNCAAQSGEHGGYWAHGPRMPESEEVYIRWYSYYTNPFVFDPVGNKSMIVHDGLIRMEAFVNTNVFGSGKPTVILYGNGASPCAAQPTPANGEYSSCIIRSQNRGNDLKIEPGNWYLFEWHIKLNTPGKGDGVTRLWVDKVTPGQPGPAAQTLRLSYSDCTFRADSDSKVRQLWLSAYENMMSQDAPVSGSAQHTRWDQIVVSRQPIGPLSGAGTAPPPNPAPLPPTGLKRVQ